MEENNKPKDYELEIRANTEIDPKYNLQVIEDVEYETWDGCCFVFLAYILIPTILGPIFCCKGLFTLSQNECAIITLFGKYKGTVRTPGYHWINPFCEWQIVSLKNQNTSPPKLFVNDKRGNPIEIDIVLIWRIINPIKSIFNVQSFTSYLQLQSEAALRHLAASFAYDHVGNENEITLLHGCETVNKFLLEELNERVRNAGLYIEEARIIHLCYDKQIQNVMLKRQQAGALVGARKTLVEGCTSIVKQTISELSQDIHFSEETKASMASNLLIVLASEGQTLPLLHMNKV